MALSSGTRLGPYEVVAPLGAGGMGEVYRARDPRLGREVALKVLPEAFAADAEYMVRFKREAQLLASLSHPHIAGLYGIEESPSGRALVMELVEGETLAQHVFRAPMPVEEAVAVARQIAEALECAHESGVIHRDLKPANIKLLPSGKVKVLDFGLAKAIEPMATGASPASSPTITALATKMGVIVGTAAYMSPEQAKGRAVDRRSDIWSFGCVLYEMLTGKLAFPGETITDTLAAVVRGEPDWNALPATTPPRLRVLLERCLRKDAGKRLQSIGDARIELEELGAEPAAATAVAPASISTARRVLPWLAALLALGLGIAAGVLLTRRPPRPPMHFRAVTNFDGVQAQPALSPDGRSVAFVSNRDGHFNIYVGLVGGGKLIQVTTDPNVKARPRWSPDGTRLVYARLNDSGIWDVWEVAALGGTPRRLVLNAKDPVWSPDGKQLAYEDGTSRALWLADAAGQNARQLTHVDDPCCLHVEPAFSPDGREIAFMGRSGGPYAWPEVVTITTGNIRHLATTDISDAKSPAWSPDGRSIYFASGRSGTMNVWKIPAQGGAPEQITSGQGDDAQLDISADGKRIVFSTFRENLSVAQLDLAAKPGQPAIRPLTDDPARNQIAPTYSPDGRHIAYFSNLKGVEREDIWISNADGSDPVQAVHDGAVNVYPRWTADSGHLVYPSQRGSEKEYYRRIAITGGASESLGQESIDYYYDVSPTGTLLLQDRKGEILSFDPTDKKMTSLAHCPSGKHCKGERWSPDGKSIAYGVLPSREDDPDAGVWVTDLHSAPRQVFRGWMLWFERGPGNQIYVLAGKGDLQGSIWRVGWDGKGLTRAATLPLIYSYWIAIEFEPQDHFDISPDGRRIAFANNSVLHANIGMLEEGP